MCPICKEFLEWPAESGPTDFGLINHRPERFSNSRTLNKIEKGGFIFHPSNEDLSPGTPDTTPATRTCRRGPRTEKATGQWCFRRIAIGEPL